MNKIAVSALLVNIVTHKTPLSGGVRETEYKTVLIHLEFAADELPGGLEWYDRV
jgi:hypothetical protein